MTTHGGALPEGWRLTRLGDVLKLHNGFAFKPSHWGSEGLPIIRIQNLKSDQASFNHYGGELPAKYRAKHGDLLFAWSGTPGTSFGAHVWRGSDAWINQHIFRVDFSPESFDRDFLLLAINHNLRTYIAEAQGGVGLAHITKRKLNESRLITPPLGVQQRIAKRIEAFEHKRELCNGHVSKVRHVIQRFRQTGLVAAASGRLTADWRSKSSTPEWKAGRAVDVCAKVQSGTTPKVWHQDSSDGIPFLKVYNIVDQKLEFDYRPQFISQELHRGAMSRATALPGDVVMNIVGPPLGKVAIITDQYPEWSINQALTLFRPSELVTSEWLYVFLCSGLSVREVLSQTRGTVGQVNISLSQCRNFTIPIPSVEEQLEITRRVDVLLKTADQIVEHINRATRQVERSARAVLGKAFRGELVA